MTFFWNAANIERLKTLWGDGNKSASVIAGIMEISRCAVLGKAHRLGLEKRSPRNGLHYNAAPRKKAVHRTVTRIVRGNGNSNHMRVITSREAAEQFKLRCIEIVPLGLSLLELEPNHCRYPYGDETITFCGHPIKENSSYCTPHYFLCWTPPKPRHDLAMRRAAA